MGFFFPFIHFYKKTYSFFTLAKKRESICWDFSQCQHLKRFGWLHFWSESLRWSDSWTFWRVSDPPSIEDNVSFSDLNNWTPCPRLEILKFETFRPESSPCAVLAYGIWSQCFPDGPADLHIFPYSTQYHFPHIQNTMIIHVTFTCFTGFITVLGNNPSVTWILPFC